MNATNLAAEIPCFGVAPDCLVIMLLLGAMTGAYFVAWWKLGPAHAPVVHLGLHLRSGSMLR